MLCTNCVQSDMLTVCATLPCFITQSPQAGSAKRATQDEELDEEFEAMAATAMLHHMTPTQAMDQAALLVSIPF